MADDSAKAPVTDSRDAGFNPEVEASHAEAEAAAAEAAARAQVARLYASLHHVRRLIRTARPAVRALWRQRHDGSDPVIAWRSHGLGYS